MRCSNYEFTLNIECKYNGLSPSVTARYFAYKNRLCCQVCYAHSDSVAFVIKSSRPRIHPLFIVHPPFLPPPPFPPFVQFPFFWIHLAIHLDFTQEYTKPIQEESGIEPHSPLQNREGDEESGSDGSANGAYRDEVNVQIAAPTDKAEQSGSGISDVEEEGYCNFSSRENIMSWS